MLSVVIPAYNEAQTLGRSIQELTEALNSAGFEYELLVVNDGSSDGTEQKLIELETVYPALRHVNNEHKHGFGHAVRCGLSQYRGEAVAVVMADNSDSPQDLIAYYRMLQEGYQCAFGSRFVPGARVENYPRLKRMLNRLGNWLIGLLFRQRYGDFTNPFKCYRRSVIDGMQPLVSGQFNLAIEMSVKAVAQGATYAVIPTSWRNRDAGLSKFKVVSQSYLYLLTLFYCLVVTKVGSVLDRSARSSLSDSASRSSKSVRSL
jgi:dolichol-phosphate mannosyltransferase